MSEWTVKLMLAVMVTGASAMAGRALCMGERRRVEMLLGLTRAVPRLRLSMLERMMPLGSALRETGNALLVHIAGDIDEGLSAREAWRRCRGELRERGALLDCLSDDDMVRIDLMMADLGASGRAEQALILDAAEAGLQKLCEAAQKAANERGRLYTNLGMLMGLSISVCLL